MPNAPVIIKEQGWGDTVLTTRSSSRDAVDAAIAELESIKRACYEPDIFDIKAEPEAARDYADLAERAFAAGRELAAYLIDKAAYSTQMQPKEADEPGDWVRGLDIDDALFRVREEADAYDFNIDNGF